MKMALYFLPCKDDKEADKISQALLDNRLIACAKKTPVSSQFFWKGSVEKDNETLLILESIEEKYNEIEKVVRQKHSYKTFVLTCLPVSRYSKEVEEWLEDAIK